MNWIVETLGQGGSIAGAILAIGGVISWLVMFLQRKMRAAAAKENAELSHRQGQAVNRLEHVEGAVDGLRNDILQLTEKQQTMQDRVTGIEKSMTSVATAHAVTEVSARVRELAATVNATVVPLREQVDTLYKAAIADAQERRK